MRILSDIERRVLVSASMQADARIDQIAKNARVKYRSAHAALQRMRDFLARNPKNKSGAHRYTLEEFGLDAERETARFAAYARRFGL